MGEEYLLFAIMAEKHGADISVMQEPTPSLGGEGVDLSGRSKELPESRSDTGDESTGEENLCVAPCWYYLLALLTVTAIVPIQMSKRAYPIQTRICPSIPFARGFWELSEQLL